MREILPPSVLIARDPLSAITPMANMAAALRRECSLLSEAVREPMAIG